MQLGRVVRPAHAGSPPRGRGRSADQCRRDGRHGAHPRAGGDGLRQTARSRLPLRAHPRAGGDGALELASRVGRRGLTPARAGTVEPGSGTHGEREGSPPRGRGRWFRSSSVTGHVGLTPARAGTVAPRATQPVDRGAHPRAGGDGSTSRRRNHAVRRAHPRAGGDGRRLILATIRSPTGSPPRGRGRSVRSTSAATAPRAHPRAGGDGRRHRWPTSSGRGLTPARAGTVWRGSARARRGRGSPPRGRGRSGPLPVGLSGRGSPPRGRGRSRCRRARRRPRAHPRAGGDGAVGHARPCRWRRAHPRAGGDGRYWRGLTTAGRGLTPARAGTVATAGRGCRHAGLTPARAGTVLARSTAGDGRAHPRAGGDGRRPASSSHSAPGSPPRGRGRSSADCPARRDAGSPPRGRGRSRGTEPRASRTQGSPPRGRGRSTARDAQPTLDGLTPARAGTVPRRCRSRPGRRAHPRAGGDGRRALDREVRLGRAHPRAGGDGSRDSSRTPQSTGSPPRGRGRSPAPTAGATRHGLTPARAGTVRLHRWQSRWCAGSPPRGRGRSRVARRSHARPAGSPPRGRGRSLGPMSWCATSTGSPPRGRGRSSVAVCHHWRRWAHPRAGGDGRPHG